MKTDRTIEGEKACRSRAVSKKALYKLATALVNEAHRRGYKALRKPPTEALRTIAAHKAHNTRLKKKVAS